MKDVRILIVEDDTRMLSTLRELYQMVFSAHGYRAFIEHAGTVDEARRSAKAAREKPFDFVSLDVNLGDAMLTGLDVLDTLKRFRSAWMVALLTGVETDITINRSMGDDRAEKLRKHLRRDAYARFPAERLLVVEKPSAGLSEDEAYTLLSNRVEQIALVYEEVGRLRYVFRPIEVTSLKRVPAPKGAKVRRAFIETVNLHWQTRFNCGELRTLPDMAGFKTLNYILSRGADQSITPEEALAIEPKKEPQESSAFGVDTVAEYFESQGIEWKSLSEAERRQVIRAALSLQFKRYVELRGYQDEDDLSPAEEEELGRIVRELGPLAEAAEISYRRVSHPEGHLDTSNGEISLSEMAQGDLHVHRMGNYDRLRSDQRGLDSPSSQLFRARMKRVRDCLRENGLADFAEHIEAYVQSTGSNWSYNPPGGIEWTT